VELARTKHAHLRVVVLDGEEVDALEAYAPAVPIGGTLFDVDPLVVLPFLEDEGAVADEC
jgi:hypothetical protein